MPQAMMYYAVEPPTKWHAGFTGSKPNQVPIYFSCADCGAKEPEIAGIISSDGSYNGIGLLGELDGCNLRPAMFCAPCYAKRIGKATEQSCPRCSRPNVDPGSLETRGGVLMCCQCIQELEEAQVVTLPQPMEVTHGR